MMTVILRIDGGRGLFAAENVENVRAQLSPFLTAHPSLTGRGSAGRTVWHMGCPIRGCEGLRVLGTWVKPGWGLGIPEIGRPGISNPRKLSSNAVIGQSFRRQREWFRGT